MRAWSKDWWEDERAEVLEEHQRVRRRAVWEEMRRREGRRRRACWGWVQVVLGVLVLGVMAWGWPEAGGGWGALPVWLVGQVLFLGGVVRVMWARKEARR